MLKAGDYVRCMNISGARIELTLGKYYQIISVDTTGVDRLHMYYINDDNNKYSAFFIHRFEYDLKYNRKKKLDRLKIL